MKLKVKINIYLSFSRIFFTIEMRDNGLKVVNWGLPWDPCNRDNRTNCFLCHRLALSVFLLTKNSLKLFRRITLSCRKITQTYFITGSNRFNQGKKYLEHFQYFEVSLETSRTLYSAHLSKFGAQLFLRVPFSPSLALGQ